MSISPRKTPGLPDGIGQASQLLFLIVAAMLLVWAGLTSVYTVGAESEAVVLRLGRYVKTVKPGLHFKLPFGIDRRYKVAVLRQMKQEFGFATPGATNPYQSGGPAEQEEERSMVSGDLNAAQVEWVVQYRIKDPQQYLFHVRNPDETLRFASESAMREVVGDRTVDEVITIGRQEIENVALERLRSLVDRYEMGLYIDQVQLKNVNPPESVQESFNEVNRGSKRSSGRLTWPAVSTTKSCRRLVVKRTRRSRRLRATPPNESTRPKAMWRRLRAAGTIPEGTGSHQAAAVSGDDVQGVAEGWQDGGCRRRGGQQGAAAVGSWR